MSIRKNILTLLLGGALILGSLTGCGADSSDSAQTQTEGTESITEEAAPKEGEVQEETPDPAETESSSEEPEGASAEKTEEERLQLTQVKTIEDSDYLRLRKTFFGNTFDPQTMNWPELYVECYEGLYSSVQQNGVTYYRTAGAERVTVSDDGLTVTFYLRRDAKWSDKISVTAGDYEYAWKHLLDPSQKFSYAYILDNVQGAKAYRTKAGSVDEVGIHALDAYTLQISLVEPDPDFYKKTISPALYPIRQDALEAANDLGHWGEYWENCVYNGPYKVTDYDPTHYVLLERNEYYWDQVDVTADQVLWYLQVSDEMAMELFEEGHLDVLNLYSADDQSLKEQAAAGTISSMTISLPELKYISFHFDGPSGITDLKAVRQVLSMTIDRESLAEQTGQIAAYGLVPTTYTLDDYPYRILQEEPLREAASDYAENPEQLEKLIQTAFGTERGAVHLIVLTYETSALEQKVLSILTSMWQEKLGITVEVQTAESYSAFKEAREAGNYDLIYTTYSQAYDDIASYMNSFRGGSRINNGSYESPVYDQYLNQASGIRDRDTRSSLIAAAEEDLLSDHMYVIPLLYGTETLYYKNEVTGLTANPYSTNPEAAYADYSARFIVEEPGEAPEETETEAPEEAEEDKKGTSLFSGWTKGK